MARKARPAVAGRATGPSAACCAIRAGVLLQTPSSQNNFLYQLGVGSQDNPAVFSAPAGLGKLRSGPVFLRAGFQSELALRPDQNTGAESQSVDWTRLRPRSGSPLRTTSTTGGSGSRLNLSAWGEISGLRRGTSSRSGRSSRTYLIACSTPRRFLATPTATPLANGSADAEVSGDACRAAGLTNLRQSRADPRRPSGSAAPGAKQHSVHRQPRRRARFARGTRSSGAPQPHLLSAPSRLRCRSGWAPQRTRIAEVRQAVVDDSGDPCDVCFRVVIAKAGQSRRRIRAPRTR